jgi:microcystin-dependent protein
MTDSYLGQILIGGWNFAPRGTAMCDGQLLSIQQNAALFSLLGTTYGGNGTSNFQLPNLQGRSMIHQGTGPGLSTYVLGEATGTESVSILTSNMPAHTHVFNGSTSTFSASGAQPHATENVPVAGSVLGHSVDIKAPPVSAPAIYCPSGTATPVALGGLNVAGTNSITGQSIPLSIVNPLLVVTVVIVMAGIFPSRS